MTLEQFKADVRALALKEENETDPANVEWLIGDDEHLDQQYNDRYEDMTAQDYFDEQMDALND